MCGLCLRRKINPLIDACSGTLRKPDGLGEGEEATDKLCGGRVMRPRLLLRDCGLLRPVEAAWMELQATASAQDPDHAFHREFRVRDEGATSGAHCVFNHGVHLQRPFCS